MRIPGEGHDYERKLNRDHIRMAGLRSRKIIEFVSAIFETFKGQVQKDGRFRIMVSRLEVAGPPVANKQLSGSLLQTKKRLGLFSPRRLGSPPPELPNHYSILGL
jgi:hypothetical protein